MSDKNDLKQAQAVYQSLCEMLDDRKWRYEKLDDDLTIRCSAQGEDLPMEILIEVDKQRKIVSLLSQMPFTVAENRRAPMAVAVSRANNGLVDGSFDFNMFSGKIIFRLTSSYRESLIGKRLLEYMLMYSCFVIDTYNDKLLVVATQDMAVDQIINFIK